MKRRPLQIGERVRVRGSKDKGTVKQTYPSDMQVIVEFSALSSIGIYHPEQLIRLVPKKPVPLREIWVNLYDDGSADAYADQEAAIRTLAPLGLEEVAVRFIEARRNKK